jgi:hypothetical protein
VPDLLTVPYNKDDLRRRASLPAVCTSLGIQLDSELRAICPFHDDHDPSFSLYEDANGVQRWGCFPCGKLGDVFDLVQLVRGVSFGEAIRYVADVGTKEVPSPRRPRKQVLDRRALETYVDAAQDRVKTDESDGYLCVAAGLTDERDVERDKKLRYLGWGVDESANVVIPHYSGVGQLTGCKIRSLDGIKWAFPGSAFPFLYGSWFPQQASRLVLCEGETDLEHAFEKAGGADVRALPTGASSRTPSLVDQVCRWRTVYLALDADEAGREATTRWIVALAERGIIGMEVRVLPIPDGEDLRSCDTEVTKLMETSKRAV